MAEEIDETKLGPGVFEDVRFTIIPTRDLSEDAAKKVPGTPLTRSELRVRMARLKEHQVKQTLEEEGATFVPLREDGRIQPLTAVTHIISTTADFDRYHDALAGYVHIVKPSWADESMLKSKQVNPRLHSPDPCLIFTGLTVTFADIPQGDKEAISGGVVAMGGICSEILTKQVTHIVTLTMNDTCKLATEKNLRCKIVLPHWFDHCFRLRRRISEEPYTLPDPEYLDHLNPDIVPTPRNSDITGASSPDGDAPDAVFHPTKRRPLEALRNKTIMIGQDLRLSNRTRNNLKKIIEETGAITDNIDEADAYVCKYREGYEYVKASQDGKTVGNLAWLFHLITHDIWTTPMIRIMHYPVPRNGIPGFETYKISISNYTGEARVYLENLVKALGADFTKNLRESNTHLITAHDKSEKVDAAREWGIEILNHIWLEESYAKCKRQPTSRPQYTLFPKNTNLGEVIGKTTLNRKALGALYFPRDLSSSTLGRQGSSMSMKVESRATTVDPMEIEPTSELASPLTEESEYPSAEDPSALQEVDDNMDLDELGPTPIQKDRRPRNPKNPPHTPAVRAVSGDGKENVTPSHGSRSAKDKANSSLRVAAADMALYDKEKKRKGGVTHGRERRPSGTKDSVSKDGPVSRKRKSTEIDDDSDTADESINVAQSKTSAQKKAKTETTSYKMMTTGFDRWEKSPKSESKEKNELRNLGVHLTEVPSQADILVAPALLRTKKFLCAIAYAPIVVGPSFVEACLKDETVDPQAHLLVDRDGEDRFGIKLQETLARAKKNQRSLFKGWQIFVTEKVKGGFETYKAIVEANGGDCGMYKGRTDMKASQRSFHAMGGRGGADNPAAESQGEDKGDTLYLVSGTSRAEVEMWPKFRLQAEKEDFVPVIASTDWLLACAMMQEFVWREEWELSEDMVGK